MRNLKIRLLVFLFLPLLLTGCSVALVGAGAAGTLVVSADGVTSYFDTDVSGLWQVAFNVLEESGDILKSSKASASIQAKVSGSLVRVRVEEVTDKTVKLTVKARKNLLPKVELAHDITNKISERLRID
ncbi:MAG: DUF3568 family protein [Candidatus Omnitrophica bacterium]|nr:DUF3568 family protein [Candidatus Omnitrophota bacterium]